MEGRGEGEHGWRYPGAVGVLCNDQGLMKCIFSGEHCTTRPERYVHTVPNQILLIHNT